MKQLMLHAVFLLVIFATTKVFSQELHTHSNAASISNESNSVDGWGGNTTNSSVSNELYSGSYSIEILAHNSGWYRTEYIVPTVVGQEYQISIYAKSSSNTSPGIYWEGWTDNGNAISIGPTWTKHTATKIAAGTSGTIFVYTGTPAVTGDIVYIDHISITPLSSTDTQSPSIPTLSNTGQSQTTVNLSWSGATDNIGVTGYKVFKDGTLETTLGNITTYQVTGLIASTTYGFTVTALDAAGNESTSSNSVSVTTNSTSGGGGGTSVWSESGTTASYSGEVAVGLAAVPTGYKMAIDGKLVTEEVRVELSDSWPDYVFQEDYDLPTLEEIQRHIKEKGHLPNIPSAQEVEANGIEVGEMNRLLLEKIEELMLHTIQLNEQNKQQREINKQLRKELQTLKKIVDENF